MLGDRGSACWQRFRRGPMTASQSKSPTASPRSRSIAPTSSTRSIPRCSRRSSPRANSSAEWRACAPSCSPAPAKAFAPASTRRHSPRLRPGARRPKLGDLAKRTHGIANAFQQAAYVWRTLPVPVIAAIHGVALGGGFQIALGADIRYVAPDARLAILEIKWGIVPDMGGIALMRELARSDVVRELAMTGRIFSGAEALDLWLRHQPPRRSARRRSRDRQGDRRPQPGCGARHQAPPQHSER